VELVELYLPQMGGTIVYTVDDPGEAAPKGPSLPPLPEGGWRDRGRDVADAAIAAVPFVGGSLQILIEDVITPSLEKRKQAWLGLLGEIVEELRARLEGFDPASLETNGQFVSAVLQASRIAVNTHRNEKLVMLRDSLINLAVHGVESDLISTRFLRFIDEFEPEHFLVLRYAISPQQWYDDKGIAKESHYMGARSTILEAAGLPVAGDQLALVLRDLQSHALADTAALRGMVTEAALWDPFATKLGKQLVEFVAAQ
jgi:hypothetical protein